MNLKLHNLTYTTDEVSEAVRQGVENSNNFYLMKPFDHDYLLMKVGAALKD